MNRLAWGLILIAQESASWVTPIRRISISKIKSGSSSTPTEFDSQIESAKSILWRAAESKAEDGELVVDTLLDLEKLMRAKARVDPGVAEDTLSNLNGAWRLVFTTGTIDMQKKLKGRINYFPLKAVQCFNVNSMKITNSIMVGDFALLKFFGPFEFNNKSRKVEFDFNSLAILGFKIDLPKGKAAEIGGSTGLGSDNNAELVEKGKRPFFNWISADSTIATARGGGGGLALWKRDPEMEQKNALDASSF